MAAPSTRASFVSLMMSFLPLKTGRFLCVLADKSSRSQFVLWQYRRGLLSSRWLCHRPARREDGDAEQRCRCGVGPGVPGVEQGQHSSLRGDDDTVGSGR